MNLTKFKDSIGKNLFAIVGWLGLLALLKLEMDGQNPNNSAYNNPGTGFIFAFYYLGILWLLSLSFFIGLAESILNRKIKNTFILKNKFYNIFWILGAIFSICFILIFVFGICYSIYIS